MLYLHSILLSENGRKFKSKMFILQIVLVKRKGNYRIDVTFQIDFQQNKMLFIVIQFITISFGNISYHAK